MSILSRPIIGLRIGERLQSPEPPAPSGPITLDASESEIGTAGGDGKLTPSNNDRTGTYTIQSELGSGEYWLMAPDGFTAGEGQTIDASSGVVGCSFTVNNAPALDASNSNTVDFRAWFLNPSLGFDVVPRIEAEPDGIYDINSGEAQIVSGLSSVPKELGVWFNADTGNYGLSVIYADDTTEDFGEITGYTVGELTPTLGVYEPNGIAAADAGKTWQATFNSLAENISAPMPSGAVDWQGNAL